MASRLLTCALTVGVLLATPSMGLAAPTVGASAAAAGSFEAVAAATDRALEEAAARTAQQGVTTYAVVLNRATGRTLASTDNATTPVASESLVKLLIAAWYLVRDQGQPTPELATDLHTMIAGSDDLIASALFAPGQVTEMAQRYGLTGTTEPADGRWGSTAVTAHDLAHFLFLASQDPLVGPGLVTAMAATTPTAVDGWDQTYGVEALTDAVGTKQGWGSDNWHSGQPNAVHSVGLTDDLIVVDLQTGSEGTYTSMQSSSTAVVAAVVAATDPVDGWLGDLESVRTEAGVIEVTGWVADAQAAGRDLSIRVTATRSTDAALYPAVVGSGPVSVARADVESLTGIPGDHGFTYTLSVAEPGPYEVCVTVRHVGGDHVIGLLGCTPVVVAAPQAVSVSSTGAPTAPAVD